MSFENKNRSVATDTDALGVLSDSMTGQHVPRLSDGQSIEISGREGQPGRVEVHESGLTTIELSENLTVQVKRVVYDSTDDKLLGIASRPENTGTIVKLFKDVGPDDDKMRSEVVPRRKESVEEARARALRDITELVEKNGIEIDIPVVRGARQEWIDENDPHGGIRMSAEGGYLSFARNQPAGVIPESWQAELNADKGVSRSATTISVGPSAMVSPADMGWAVMHEDIESGKAFRPSVHVGSGYMAVETGSQANTISVHHRADSRL